MPRDFTVFLERFLYNEIRKQRKNIFHLQHQGHLICICR